MSAVPRLLSNLVYLNPFCKSLDLENDSDEETNVAEVPSQDVLMADVDSSVRYRLSPLFSSANFVQKPAKKVTIDLDNDDEEEAPPVKQQKLKDDGKLVRPGGFFFFFPPSCFLLFPP